MRQDVSNAALTLTLKHLGMDDNSCQRLQVRPTRKRLDFSVEHQPPEAANASASCAPIRALFLTSAMFVVRLRPAVNALMRPSRKGVTALPVMPCEAASFSA